MSVVQFKQKPANQETRTQEAKRLAREAVRRTRRKPLLFHNGTADNPVMIFRTSKANPNHMTQADIDAMPACYIPMSANQRYAKILRGELRITRFFRKIKMVQA